mgnify:CR=1 FL=1
MIVAVEDLTVLIADIAMLVLMLRLENDGKKDHPAARFATLVVGIPFLTWFIAEIVCNGPQILEYLLLIGVNIAFVAYVYSFRVSDQSE